MQSAYLTQDSLLDYCDLNWSSINKEKRGNPGRNPKLATKLGFQVYENARSDTCNIAIIGPNRIREDSDLCGNVGLVVGSLSQKEVKKLKVVPESAYTFKGAILGEKQWSGFINDLFMLGAVHANKIFHLSIEDGREMDSKELWNEKTQALTTLGRELLLLELAGYSKIETEGPNTNSFFGHVFVPPIRDNPPSISFEEYRRKIIQCKNFNQISTLFSRSVAWSAYIYPCQ